VCCYPCVYGAGCSRECSAPPTNPRSTCDCTLWWCAGAVLPPLTGIVVRARQAEGFGCGASMGTAAWAFVLETCCCVCVGAPCAMNEYRLEMPINISELLLNSAANFTVVDTQESAYIPTSSRPVSPQWQAGSSPATSRGSSPRLDGPTPEPSPRENGDGRDTPAPFESPH